MNKKAEKWKEEERENRNERKEEGKHLDVFFWNKKENGKEPEEKRNQRAYPWVRL